MEKAKEKAREHLYLAALLHDIGKFYQRADSGSVSTSKYLIEYNKNESSFLPQSKGFYTHKHCLWTAQFIDDNNSVFKNLIGSDISDLTDKNNLLNLAACHHLQKEQLTMLGQIVKEADCLSSGMDRESELAFKDEQDEKNWDVLKKTRMTSILETVLSEKEMVKYHLPVSEVSLTKSYFPKESFTSNPDYGKLWLEFVKEFKFIQSNDYRVFSETFLNLLYKYAACIPSSTINFSDVSLYDHSKTTAALAICMYDFQQSCEVTDKPFLLIGADFSGIQNYLYQIVSKYAGKNLKGRSFFLRILSDAVVRYLLKELDLFQANIVYNSGGGFYIIAPNTTFVREKLQVATQMIEKKFFRSFGTMLFVAIESVPLSKDDLMHKDENHNLGTIWHDLFEKRDKKKACKFAGVIEQKYIKFFMPLMKGGDALRDEITGEEFTKKELSKNRDLTIKKDTNRQILLGEKLRETEIMIVSDRLLACWKGKFYIKPAYLGYYYYFIKENDLTESVDNVSIIRFNNANFNIPIKGNNNIYEFQFYGGNKYSGQTFDEMTENPNFSRLGVLRMDVDNLGSIFQSGIKAERAILSRFAALSRSFDYFFSGYLNTIWRETDKDRSLIIYSGGDDVFIVGSWDVCIELAKKIRNDFRKFTCANPAFSISGGIAIEPQKFPLMKAAEEAAQEEHHAKEHVIAAGVKQLDKNSISFMDFSLNWDTEFPAVESLKNTLVDLVSQQNEAKSLLSKIMIHAANAGIKEHQITNIKTYWTLTYDMSRMKERVKSDKSKLLIDNLIKEVCGNKSSIAGTYYHPLELWAFAARWAELEIRTKKE
ncbi:MAG: type III-A CRISPR-associated protein Cas10/Csm1 [Tannerella sp.]|jgi:CRISPR-associated protein Csm1|nr:type III-A CRISPR-associated protein Cas10/Csm1 [Tannerella sp.]